ncbi:hypothetical protein ACQ5SK_37950 [Bradyrhizobium japonicum]|nr:hypothetical protein RN69_30175 [Bradyrhizobium japonicum]
MRVGAERQRDHVFLMLRLGLTKYVGMVAPIIGFDLNTRFDRTTWNICIIAWNAANVSVMPGIRRAPSAVLTECAVKNAILLLFG